MNFKTKLSVTKNYKETLSIWSRGWNLVLTIHYFKSNVINVFIPTLPLHFFSARVDFKGHISLSQRPINSPYFIHLWAHFSRLLPLAGLTSITSHCHSSLVLMSSWQSWKLLGLRRTIKSFYLSLRNWGGGLCVFIYFCKGLSLSPH